MKKRLEAMAARINNRMIAGVAAVSVLVGGTAFGQVGGDPLEFDPVRFPVDPGDMVGSILDAIGNVLVVVIPALVGVVLIKKAFRWMTNRAGV